MRSGAQNTRIACTFSSGPRVRATVVFDNVDRRDDVQGQRVLWFFLRYTRLLFVFFVFSSKVVVINEGGWMSACR